MSTSWVPPYFGSFQELIAALMHNPFLGGGDGGKPGPHHFAMPMAEPSPSPWSPPVSFLLSAISLTEVAAKMPDGQLKKELQTQGSKAIATFIDDCGNVPLLPWRWPWPGPPPFALSIVSELTIVANTLHEGSFRNQVLEVAGEIVQKAAGSAGTPGLQG